MTKKKLTLKDFNLTCPSQQNGVSFNFALSKNLTNSLGIKECLPPILTGTRPYNIPANVTKILGLSHFSQYAHTSQKSTNRLLLYGDDGKLYINQMFANSYNFMPQYSLTFGSNPVCLCYRYEDTECAILASNDKTVIWRSNTQPYVAENVPIVNSICICNNILFCTLLKECYKIWYNKNLDFEKLGKEDSSSGYILMDVELGHARKVITFFDSVYIFRDYGISKVSIYKNELVVSEVYKSNTLICISTICACGNYIIFLTENGIYSFNGTKVNKLEFNLNNLLPNLQNASCASLGNLYYLSLKLNFLDENKILCEQNECVNNALLVLNVEDNSYQILRGVDILSLLPIKTQQWETMLAIFNSGNTRTIGEVFLESSFFGEVLPKLFCKKNVFEDDALKLVTKLKVNCTSGTKFELQFLNNTLNFVAQKDGVNIFCFKQLCNNLNITITSKNNLCKVNIFEVEYYDC